MKIKYIALVAIFSGFLAQGQDDYMSLLLPENVVIGMNQSVFSSLRPNAKKMNYPPLAGITNSIALFEIERKASPPFCYQYWFVNGQLRSATKELIHVGRFDESIVDSIHANISKNLVKQSEEKVLRINEQTMQPILVAAELWKDEKRGIDVYFVKATNETTTIVFDPKYLSGENFFLSRESMQKVKRSLDDIQEKSQSLQKTNR